MLTEKEAEEKLRGLAQEFQNLMKQRQYGKAKARYEVARSCCDNGAVRGYQRGAVRSAWRKGRDFEKWSISGRVGAESAL